MIFLHIYYIKQSLYATFSFEILSVILEMLEYWLPILPAGGNIFETGMNYKLLSGKSGLDDACFILYVVMKRKLSRPVDIESSIPFRSPFLPHLVLSASVYRILGKDHCNKHAFKCLLKGLAFSLSSFFNTHSLFTEPTPLLRHLVLSNHVTLLDIEANLLELTFFL